ncbi:hypothetical protein RS694_14315 [Rhodoferax saidenbachensis]|uniref:Uncharacterized protein n=2 Tax=Rhodoferax saidenbachensis TaxID=1484693 RepID=A0A1P8KC59_9BURK|nr:hypothetical protein RS694_14315 [Rhodoferax saidenbachensis]
MYCCVPKPPWFTHAVRFVLTAGLCALALTPAPARAEKFNLVYARQYAETDSRLDYPVRLLELALKKAGADYNIQSDARSMSQDASLKRLAEGGSVNVVWTMTSKQREQELLPIRIPLDKGLFGYRIAFVRQQDRNALAKVKTLADMRRFAAGQGHDWPDTQILQGNGLNVVTAPAFDGLFNMLRAGRFDYFPRSVLEIWDEEEQAGAQQLVVDDKIVLHYPAAIYYFVNKKDRALASALERGLNKAIADGSFDTLFYERYGEPIKRANLRQRSAIALKNPLLPPETPLSRKALWLDINALPK